jgi:ribosomal 30S subunit maturation factor RimM
VLLVAADADEAGALVETFGVIGWAFVAEAAEVTDETGALVETFGVIGWVLVAEAVEAGALVETFGVIGWAFVAEAIEVADAPWTPAAVAGGAISTVTLGPLVPALLAGVSP